jgi:serine/threonine-protein kinase
MGVVVSARHETLDQHVAIKFLLPTYLQNQEAVLRFLREARAAAKLQSAHVARVIDVGKLENGAPYMVMEFLEGRDLAQELEVRGKLPVTEAVDFILQALDAVAEAHSMGIVHRDLKPANLFLAERNDGVRSVKVLDFGISKVDDASSVSVTSTGATMGSPLYMSPEQFRSSKTVDARSDIWAIGVILYELLSGRPPFLGESIGEVFAMILESSPTPLRTLGVPDAMSAIVERCLQRDREQRWSDVSTLALELSAFGSEHSSANVRRIASLLGKPAPSLRSPSSAHGLPEPRHSTAAVALSGQHQGPATPGGSSRSRKGMIAGASGGALLIAAVAWFASSSSGASKPGALASVVASASTPPVVPSAAPAISVVTPVVLPVEPVASAAAPASAPSPRLPGPPGPPTTKTRKPRTDILGRD